MHTTPDFRKHGGAIVDVIKIDFKRSALTSKVYEEANLLMYASQPQSQANSCGSFGGGGSFGPPICNSVLEGGHVLGVGYTHRFQCRFFILVGI